MQDGHELTRAKRKRPRAFENLGQCLKPQGCVFDRPRIKHCSLCHRPETPLVVAQLVTLLIFAMLTTLATVRFPPERVREV